MLGKMIKHEFKATSRLLLPLNLLTVALAPILALLFRLSRGFGENNLVGGIMAGISMTGFFLLLAAVCVGSALFIVIRFYRTVATSEAYLTFCLPVKSNHILISKFLVGVVWEILSVAVVIGSAYLMLVIQGSNILNEAFDVFSKITPLIVAEYGSLAFFFIHIGLIILASIVAGTLSFFLAICLGQMFNEHRVLASIGMYVALYTVSQIISAIAVVPFVAKGSAEIVIGSASAFHVEPDSIPAFGLLTTLGVIQIVFGVVYFIVCSYILKKKTNVR